MKVYDDHGVTVHHGDCIEVMRTLPDNSVDSVVTDPPYGLEFMGKDWDAPWRDSAATIGEGGKARIGTDAESGWSRYNLDRPQAYVAGVPFQLWCQEWATEALRILKPGGHLVAFGGTRTYHRLACAIEDAGFEIRDSLHWMYSQGFPKSLDVSKAIDKAAGAEREVVASVFRGNNDGTSAGIMGEAVPRTDTITAPATDAARQWQGWGTALKPSHEPIVWARKPFSVVPLWGEVNDLHHMIGALLWLSLSPAKRAELSSPSSQVGQRGAMCASALASAATDTLLARSAETDTSKSRETASTLLSIVSSWSAILDALSRQRITSTTSTKSSTTTALRTLSSLLAPLTLRSTMPQCQCLIGGQLSNASNVAESSSADWSSWSDTLSTSVPESATGPIALAVESALAAIAEQLSDDPEAGSTAGQSATTKADAGGSPAHEPIVLARKPLTGTVAGNVQEYGTGALNIDGCRVGTNGETWGGNEANAHSDYSGKVLGKFAKQYAKPSHPAGRWPANVLFSHTPDCQQDGECVPGCPVAGLDAQSGHSVSGQPREDRGTGGIWSPSSGKPAGQQHGDAGGASRFFPVFDWPFHYHPKAPSHERPRDTVSHPTVKPLGLMQWLVRLVTPPSGTVLEPFAGSGTTAEACVVEGFSCIAIEREDDYIPLIVQRLSKPIERTLL